jgi:hypothetical protein
MPALTTASSFPSSETALATMSLTNRMFVIKSCVYSIVQLDEKINRDSRWGLYSESELIDLKLLSICERNTEGTRNRGK